MDLDGFLPELSRLNDNLERLHADAEDLKPLKTDLRDLVQQLKGIQGSAKSIRSAAKQIYVLNQILLQIKKTAGWSGVLKSMLDGLVRSVTPGGRK